jgi:hypothetical protein
VLPLVAEFEHDLILQRTNEGRARPWRSAHGRKPKLTMYQAREALKRVAARKTLREIALSHNSITRRSRGSKRGTPPR